MFVDLTESQGEWFEFRMSRIDQNTGEIVWDNPMPQTRVRVRSMKPFFEDKISKRERIVEWKINPKTRANEKHTNFKELSPDEAKQERDDAFDYAITGLEGFADKTTREDFKCTREVKLGLMKKDWFDRFFADCQQNLDASSIEFDKELEKNS